MSNLFRTLVLYLYLNLIGYITRKYTVLIVEYVQGYKTREPARAALLLLTALREEGDQPAQPCQEEDQGEQGSLHR